MPRGRPPKPRHLHVLHGTYRADRHGPVDEPGAASLPPPGHLPPWRPLRPRDCPHYLTGRAESLWAEVLPALPHLHRVDAYILGVWCVLQAQAEEDLLALGASNLRLLRRIGKDLGGL